MDNPGGQLKTIARNLTIKYSYIVKKAVIVGFHIYQLTL